MNAPLITRSQTGRIVRAAVAVPPCAASPGLDEIDRLLSWVEDDQPCDALVLELTAPGDPAPGVPSREHLRRWEKLMIRIDRLPCVSLAVLDGLCVRLAMQLALACDHRVGTTRAAYRIVELKEGYLPGMNVFRLAKFVGLGVARRWIFLGEPIGAAEAHAHGLLDAVCAPDQLAATVDDLLGRLAPIHATPVRLARRLLGESFASEFEQSIGHYLASQHSCLDDLQRRAASSERAPLASDAAPGRQP